MAGGGGDLTYVNVVFNKMHKTATQHSSRGEGNHSMSEGVGGVASCVKMLIYKILPSPPLLTKLFGMHVTTRQMFDEKYCVEPGRGRAPHLRVGQGR